MDEQKVELLPEVKICLAMMTDRTRLIAEQYLVSGLGAEAESKITSRREREAAIARKQAGVEIGEVKRSESSRVDDLQTDIDELTEHIDAVMRKAAFLAAKDEIETAAVELDGERIKPYTGKELLRLGTYYEDDYLIVKLYIVENDRPKNRYTLLAYGYSPLSRFLEYRRYYGLAVTASGLSYTFGREIAYKPTPEDLKKLLEKRTTDKIIPQFGHYLKIRDEYIETIANHTIEEFRPLLEFPIVSEEAAPVVFRIARYDGVQEYRLYNDIYYIEIDEEKEKIKDYTKAADYIKVDGKVYKKLCRPEYLSITQHGNTMFGDWWSIRIEQGIQGPVFNRENWERELAEAQAFVDEKNAQDRLKPVVLNKSDVQWVTPMASDCFDRQLTREKLGIPGPDVLGIGTSQRFQAIMAIAKSHFDGDDYVDTGQVLDDLDTIIKICEKALK